jgi:hypothetical protein
MPHFVFNDMGHTPPFVKDKPFQAWTRGSVILSLSLQSREMGISHSFGQIKGPETDGPIKFEGTLKDGVPDGFGQTSDNFGTSFRPMLLQGTARPSA